MQVGVRKRGVMVHDPVAHYQLKPVSWKLHGQDIFIVDTYKYLECRIDTHGSLAAGIQSRQEGMKGLRGITPFLASRHIPAAIRIRLSMRCWFLTVERCSP